MSGGGRTVKVAGRGVTRLRGEAAGPITAPMGQIDHVPGRELIVERHVPGRFAELGFRGKAAQISFRGANGVFGPENRRVWRG
ncbi:hypothetical protein D3C73_1154430 [compost metagenome]